MTETIQTAPKAADETLRLRLRPRPRAPDRLRFRPARTPIAIARPVLLLARATPSTTADARAIDLPSIPAPRRPAGAERHQGDPGAAAGVRRRADGGRDRGQDRGDVAGADPARATGAPWSGRCASCGSARRCGSRTGSAPGSRATTVRGSGAAALQPDGRRFRRGAGRGRRDAAAALYRRQAPGGRPRPDRLPDRLGQAGRGCGRPHRLTSLRRGVAGGADRARRRHDPGHAARRRGHLPARQGR